MLTGESLLLIYEFADYALSFQRTGFPGASCLPSEAECRSQVNTLDLICSLLYCHWGLEWMGFFFFFKEGACNSRIEILPFSSYQIKITGNPGLWKNNYYTNNSYLCSTAYKAGQLPLFDLNQQCCEVRRGKCIIIPISGNQSRF